MRWLGYSMIAVLLAAILTIPFMAVAMSGRWIEFLVMLGGVCGLVGWICVAAWLMEQ